MAACVVIPVLNENGDRLEDIVRRCRKYVDEVVVVDDGSDEALIVGGGTVLRHIVNRGVGAATVTGLEYGLRRGYDYIVTLDGDGQHNPDELPLFLTALKDGAEVVIGKRDTGEMPVVKRVGNKIIEMLGEMLWRLPAGDSQSGFRGFSRTAVEGIEIFIDRYGFSTEILLEAKKKGFCVVEVPISTIYLDPYKGTSIKDGVRIMIDMLTRGWR